MQRFESVCLWKGAGDDIPIACEAASDRKTGLDVDSLAGYAAVEGKRRTDELDVLRFRLRSHGSERTAEEFSQGSHRNAFAKYSSPLLSYVDHSGFCVHGIHKDKIPPATGPRQGQMAPDVS